jgi:hypothetical protein
LKLPDEFHALAASLDQSFESVDRRLREVPADWTQVTFPRGDRLAATLHLQNLFLRARQRLDIVDRYLDETPLLFMRDLPRELPIRLITTARVAASGKKSTFGCAHLEPYARIAKTQYPNLQLIQVDPKHFHKRAIRVDELIFVIDQSIGDLSLKDSAHMSAPTKAKPAHEELDALIVLGQVILI